MLEKKAFQSGQQEVRVWTCNVWTNKPIRDKRFQILLDTIEKQKPDIVCLQEVSMPDMKQWLRKAVSTDYFLFESEMRIPTDYKFWPYMVCVALYCLSYALTFVGGALVYFFPSLLGTILIPPIFRRIFQAYAHVCSHGEFASYFFPTFKWNGEGMDLMAQKILIKRSSFTDANLIFAKPFTVQGYPEPTQLLHYIWNWVQVVLLRPGMTYVVAKHISGSQFHVFNNHLVLGDDNPQRIHQVTEMIDYMNQNINTKEDVVVTMGDYNSDPNGPAQPEIKEIRKHLNWIPTEVTWDCDRNHFVGFEDDDPGVSRVLDFIFSSKNQKWGATSSRLMFDGTKEDIISDHFGVELTMRTAVSPQERN